MNNFEYVVNTGESINFLRLSNMTAKPYNGPQVKFEHPVNLEEGYIQVIYPQRREFKAHVKPKVYKSYDYNNLYVPFESNKIDFSSFTSTTHTLEIQGEFYIEVERDLEIDIVVKTCGVLDVFVNEKNQIHYAPLSRNIVSEKECGLKLIKGINKINVFAEELSERDVLFNFEIINKYHEPLKCFTKVHEDEKVLKNIMDILYSISFERDEYEEDEEISIIYDNTLLKNDEEITLRSVAPFLKLDSFTSPYEIKVKLLRDKNKVLIDSSSLPIGTQRVSFEMASQDGEIKRHILISKYIKSPKDLDTIAKRREYVYNHLADNSPNNITKALLLADQGNFGDMFYESFKNGIDFINTHGDCSDFQTVPLLWLIIKYKDKLEDKYYEMAALTLLKFRYWLDEKGNDAMWWFSENHAFLFHISQYLAGYEFKDKVFEISQKTGQEQYGIGKDRIIKWFDLFNKNEFAEWNSTTYFPVDFIGFIALYECAPDKEIKEKAKAALDRTFEIICMNIHHNLMATTYGRVYENELKGLRNGELSMITWMFYNKGYYNLTNRSSIMFVLSDYIPPVNEQSDLDHIKEYEKFYKQGFNQVGCYIYKEKDFSIGGVINYKYKLKGHQQHIMNISFSTDEIQLWINNPGETVYSGESRPSFWAGNSTNPQVFIDKNIMLYNYDNTHSAVKYSHLYFPIELFEEYEINKNSVFCQHKGAYFGLVTTSNLSLMEISSIRNRELRFLDSTGAIFIVLGEAGRFGSYDSFKKYVNNISMEINNESTFVIGKDINYLVTNNQFYKNNKIYEYEE